MLTVALAAILTGLSLPAIAHGFDGTIYVESNNSAKDANSIIAFRYSGRAPRPVKVGEYPTGGSGSHDLSNSGALDVEGSVAISPGHKLLFAVNAGSERTAVFRIAGDGPLTPRPRSASLA